MNKETLRKLLSSSNCEDNVLAFYMMKNVNYSELQDLLGITENKNSMYYVYERFCKDVSTIWDTKINDDIAVCVGTAAILFISIKWYKDRGRIIKDSIYD